MLCIWKMSVVLHYAVIPTFCGGQTFNGVGVGLAVIGSSETSTQLVVISRVV